MREIIKFTDKTFNTPTERDRENIKKNLQYLIVKYGYSKTLKMLKELE